eukprot:1602846-Rhodomonas_salina.2
MRAAGPADRALESVVGGLGVGPGPPRSGGHALHRVLLRLAVAQLLRREVQLLQLLVLVALESLQRQLHLLRLRFLLLGGRRMHLGDARVSGGEQREARPAHAGVDVCVRIADGAERGCHLQIVIAGGADIIVDNCILVRHVPHSVNEELELMFSDRDVDCNLPHIIVDLAPVPPCDMSAPGSAYRMCGEVPYPARAVPSTVPTIPPLPPPRISRFCSSRKVWFRPEFSRLAAP